MWLYNFMTPPLAPELFIGVAYQPANRKDSLKFVRAGSDAPKVKVDPPAMEMRAVPKEPVRKRAPSPKPKNDPLERKESPRADPVLSQTAVAAQQRLMDLKGNPLNHPNFRQGQQICAVTRSPVPIPYLQ
ncbi:hypothetical protein CYMTET_23291 [Cymbomonas tetramitiformis]|uniref:Uncharacterized protein n=1 Tax=Cymbomonas tetramitiformis TaxID=36881 RepID=A0AAE0FYJ6_9CHLO|nr:hypothetical protein CYMTET_23291 [Cymbomonas tetramitiformis]